MEFLSGQHDTDICDYLIGEPAISRDGNVQVLNLKTGCV